MQEVSDAREARHIWAAAALPAPRAAVSTRGNGGRRHAHWAPRLGIPIWPKNTLVFRPARTAAVASTPPFFSGVTSINASVAAITEQQQHRITPGVPARSACASSDVSERTDSESDWWSSTHDTL
eukprot:6203026-Pleurochrysis_carterae.AAC.3